MSTWERLWSITVWQPIALNSAACSEERERTAHVVVRFMCLATSPCVRKRCCGQSGIQDGAGMGRGRSYFRWIVVGGHSVAIWRSVLEVGIWGVRRVLNLSVRGIWSQGRCMRCKWLKNTHSFL